MSLYDNDWFYLIMFLMTGLIELGWILLHFSRKNISLIANRIQDHDNQHSFSFVSMDMRTDALIAVFLSLAVSSLFRLFPGNLSHPGVDSSAFLYIGKRMLEGKQPYHDLFDHKGPLLYLIEVFGLRIGAGNQTGVWLVEWISLFFTAVFMLKLSNLIAKHRMCTYLSVLLVLGVCGWKVYQGGNFTEEYALPWISYSAIIFFSFFKSKTYRSQEIILLGVAFQVVFLLRANMVTVWIALVPFVLFCFWKERCYKEVFKCLCLFFTGIIIVTIPVLIWAYDCGFLTDLWEYYFRFNLLYTDSANRSIGFFFTLFFKFLMVLWPGMIPVFSQVFQRPKNKLLLINNWFLVVSIALACLSGRYYFHYAMVVLPALVLPVTAFFDLTANLIIRKQTTDEENSGRQKKPATTDNLDRLQPLDSCIIVLTFAFICVAAFGYRSVSAGEEQDNSASQYLLENTKASDDVLVLGNSSWCYLLSDRKTENRFFYQLPPLSISQELYNEFVEELTEKPSDYILIPGNTDERKEINTELYNIKELLDNHPSAQYRIVEEDQFEVYVRIR